MFTWNGVGLETCVVAESAGVSRYAELSLANRQSVAAVGVLLAASERLRDFALAQLE